MSLRAQRSNLSPVLRQLQGVVLPLAMMPKIALPMPSEQTYLQSIEKHTFL
ncbi:hypothetical protein [Syntrophomonas palmitatica]|uniref:hypothetical protein n=1 Tax=Syntrophomonas palmitatica TaxID=402877 RepID=UPI000AB3E808|nr:hypothetical protein [Syntrophomonas palmitatica]